jgi:hypothetical protein
MKTTYLLCTILSVVTCAGLVSAQATGTKTPVKFASVYSNLNKGCRTIHGTNGTDDADICRAPGGYQVRMYSAAAAFYINAEVKGKREFFNLATTNFDFDTRKTRIEWRLADGKPFAAIIRVPKYADPTGDEQYFGKIIGQQLSVVGLEGHEDIGFSIDAKEADANAKSRELADKAYSVRAKD